MLDWSRLWPLFDLLADEPPLPVFQGPFEIDHIYLTYGLDLSNPAHLYYLLSGLAVTWEPIERTLTGAAAATRGGAAESARDVLHPACQRLMSELWGFLPEDVASREIAREQRAVHLPNIADLEWGLLRDRVSYVLKDSGATGLDALVNVETHLTGGSDAAGANSNIQQLLLAGYCHLLVISRLHGMCMELAEDAPEVRWVLRPYFLAFASGALVLLPSDFRRLMSR